MLQRAKQLGVARVPLHLGVHGVHVVNVRHPPGIGRVARQRIGTSADARRGPRAAADRHVPALPVLPLKLAEAAVLGAGALQQPRRRCLLRRHLLRREELPQDHLQRRCTSAARRLAQVERHTHIS